MLTNIKEYFRRINIRVRAEHLAANSVSNSLYSAQVYGKKINITQLDENSSVVEVQLHAC